MNYDEILRSIAARCQEAEDFESWESEVDSYIEMLHDDLLEMKGYPFRYYVKLDNGSKLGPYVSRSQAYHDSDMTDGIVTEEKG